MAVGCDANAESPGPPVKQRRLLLIANLSAGGSRAMAGWERLLVELAARGINYDYVMTERPRHAVSLAREASPGYDIIAAVGGDGTVNEVASGILLAGEPKTALGVIPLGTGNDLAQLVGLRTPADAVEALVSGNSRMMDAIEVRCSDAGTEATRYALLYAAVGFAGELLKRTTPAVKRFFGPRYCYSVGFFRALLSFRTTSMRVRCDDREFCGAMFLVSAGNAEIVGAGAMRLSPGARADDGQLNVNVVQQLGRWEVARWFPRVLRGEHIAHPKVRYFTATTVSVESEPAIDVQMDGELFGMTPVTFEVKPKAIRVIASRDVTG